MPLNTKLLTLHFRVFSSVSQGCEHACTYEAFNLALIVLQMR